LLHTRGEECRLRILKEVVQRKREKVTGEWRKMHREELHNLFSSYIRVMKWRHLGWGETCNHTCGKSQMDVKLWSENLEGRDIMEILAQLAR
jgi:hypothetical protein